MNSFCTGKTPNTPRKRFLMDIVISNSSDKPIYEQITAQIKDAILNGQIASGQMLPSIRGLANELRVSVITTKRAYSDLEEQGFIETVPGKGCFVSGGSNELLREERLRQVESLLERAITASQSAGLSIAELHEIIDMLVESSEQPPYSPMSSGS